MAISSGRLVDYLCSFRFLFFPNCGYQIAALFKSRSCWRNHSGFHSFRLGFSVCPGPKMISSYWPPTYQSARGKNKQ